MRILAIMALLSTLFIAGCAKEGQESKDAAIADKQQSQYAKGQPIPVYDWSLERHLVISLYNARNQRVATHSVWRSDRGLIEGDCASMGFGIPYDTSLTNPIKGSVYRPSGASTDYRVLTVEQAEPNGVFASKNTAATWVMCTGDAGIIEPVYVETKVTVYPYPVTVDYDNNRVTKAGKATVQIKASR